MADRSSHSQLTEARTASWRDLIARAARRLLAAGGGLFVAVGLEDALAREGSFAGQMWTSFTTS